MISILVSLIISVAGAVEGQFSYDGKFEVLSQIRYENVYASAQAGKMRLIELQNEGYTCQYKGTFVQCKYLFDTVSAIPDGVSTRLPSANHVEFAPEKSKELVSKGNSVSIYEAAQDVTVDGSHFDKVKYLINGDLEKATVGDSEDLASYHSFIVGTDGIAVLDSVPVTESQWAYSIYAVKYSLSKK